MVITVRSFTTTQSKAETSLIPELYHLAHYYLLKTPMQRQDVVYNFIRESVDSLCRDGADMQYMQYF